MPTKRDETRRLRQEIADLREAIAQLVGLVDAHGVDIGALELLYRADVFAAACDETRKVREAEPATPRLRVIQGGR